MSDAHAADPNLPPTQAQQRPAELLDRFVAKLIDFILLGVVYGIIAAVLAVGVAFSSGSMWVTGMVTTLVLAALQVGYFTFMESNQGRTVGKMVMKLRVVGPGGAAPTTEEALKRNIWMALSLLGIIPFIGWLLQLAASVTAVVTIALGINNDTVNRQAWHDRLGGGTQVLKVG